MQNVSEPGRLVPYLIIKMPVFSSQKSDIFCPGSEVSEFLKDYANSVQRDLEISHQVSNFLKFQILRQKQALSQDVLFGKG